MAWPKTMNININEELVAFVEKSAIADGVTSEVWVERKVNATIKRMIKDEAINQINSAQVEEVTRFTSAIEVVKSEIVAEKALLEAAKAEPLILDIEPEIATTTEEIIK
jgi:hypothetical protein